MGSARIGKNNPWYGRESPMTRFMREKGLVSKNKQPMRLMKNGVRKLLHRRIMENKLGRELTNEEVVHHIDGDNQNNLLSNLKLMPSKSFHSYQHWCNLKGGDAK